MHLYLLRHAQSESTARWQKNPGESFHYPDPHLTATGRKQAQAAARALARSTREQQTNPHDPWNRSGFNITHIYTSLMNRAVETANTIASKLDLPMLGRTDLHEWGGIYEWDLEKDERVGLPGNNRAFFEENYPRLVLPPDFNDDGWWSRPHEPSTEVTARSRRVLDSLIGRHRNTSDRVLMVSHGGFLNHFITTLVNLPAEQTQRNLDDNVWFVLNNTGIPRVDIGPIFTGVVYHNRTDHLSAKLVT